MDKISRHSEGDFDESDVEDLPTPGRNLDDTHTSRIYAELTEQNELIVQILKNQQDLCEEHKITAAKVQNSLALLIVATRHNINRCMCNK